MGRTAHKNKPNISKDRVQKPGPSKPPAKTVEPENKVNAISEALEANRGIINEDTDSLGASDFEPAKEPVKPKQEDIITEEVIIAPGEAERQRLLSHIRARFNNVGVSYDNLNPEIVVNGPASIIKTAEDNMNESIKEVQAKQAEANKPQYPKVTLEDYKILKQYQNFADRFRIHKVLSGLSSRELDLLEGVMHRAFEPTYKTDFWCTFCIGEFVTDLYNYFDKWGQASKEQVAEYQTLLVNDQF